jgi:hypothetical protein
VIAGGVLQTDRPLVPSHLATVCRRRKIHNPRLLALVQNASPLRPSSQSCISMLSLPRVASRLQMLLVAHPRIAVPWDLPYCLDPASCLAPRSSAPPSRTLENVSDALQMGHRRLPSHRVADCKDSKWCYHCLIWRVCSRNLRVQHLPLWVFCAATRVSNVSKVVQMSPVASLVLQTP